MLVLFDHSTPAPLRYALKAHTVVEAVERGWETLANGALLQEAEAAGFEVFITADKNIRYQQNLTRRRIAILVLENAQWPILRPHVGRVVAAVNAATTWQLHRSPDTPRRLGQAFSPRTIRNPVVRQNSSGLSIISALLVAARSTPELRLITMFTPRRNPCFDVLPHFHHRQSISDKQRKLRTWLESYTVTVDSLPPLLNNTRRCLKHAL